LTAFSEQLLGPAGRAAASGVVMCSVFGALNGNLLVGPRVIYAMGQDELAPKALHSVSPRFHTPALAILVLAGWASALILWVALMRASLPFLKLDETTAFDVLTDYVIFGSIVFDTLAVVSIFVFRRTRPDAERPYRCWGYPVVPALYVILPGLILVNMVLEQTLQVVCGTLFVGIGAIVYLKWFRGTGTIQER
jgi:basic amino acid/polyamine antiporter, APA family